MRMRQLAVLFGLAMAAWCAASEADAQAPRPNNPQRNNQQRYMGGPQWMQRPTLSPWLDLYRQDLGVVDPYNEFVRPKFRMQKYLLDQNRQENQQQMQQRQTQQMQQRQQTDIEGLQNPQQQAIQPRQGFSSQTGIGAGFMNYGGFMTHRSYFNY